MHEFLVRLLELFAVNRAPPSPMKSLDRSIAAARDAHLSARRALAVAMAEEAREADRCASLKAKVIDLEARAVAALRAGREDLAAQAAEAIAAIATDIGASERASQRFAAEVSLARREVDAQRRRLAELDRGHRLARIGHALAATAHTSGSGVDSFTDAEAALAQVVAKNQDARFVRAEMAPPAELLIERMSDAGFGEPVHVRASDVMARLRATAGLQVSHLLESTPDHQ